MRKTKAAPKHDDNVLYIPENPVKLLRPRNERQALLIKSICNNTITFASGYPGVGKTYIAAAKAIDLLNANIVSQIIITRPYVATEKMGFLPGDVSEKFEPYLEPYMDAFIDRVGKQALNAMLADGRIQAKPIAFLQGKTFTSAVILFDEAQNATHEQIKLVLTRIGEGTRCIITGDSDQTYITNSGFTEAMRILKNVPSLGIVEFEIEDVVRSEACRDVLLAYAEAKL